MQESSYREEAQHFFSAAMKFFCGGCACCDSYRRTTMIQQFFHNCYGGCCIWHRHRKSEPSLSVTSYLAVVAAKLLLEVMGVAGAVQGSSDILFLHDTPERMKRMWIIVLLVGGVFFIRYWWYAKHWWWYQRDYLPIKILHRRLHRLPCFQIHASKFVLNVLGGAGAIWGCAEAMRLRNPGNGWTIQALAYCLCLVEFWSDPSSIHIILILLRWIDAFIVTLILEVFGAVGAVWGFSEIVTVRNPKNNKVWRSISAAVGLVFLVRWSIHLIKFVQSEHDSVADESQVQVGETRSDEATDLELKETNYMGSTELDDDTYLNSPTSTEASESLEEHTHSFPSQSGPPPSTNPSIPQQYQRINITR